MRNLITSCLSFSVLLASVYATPAQSLEAIGYETTISERGQDTTSVGYVGAYFLGAQPDVYFYLSNGNEATSFRALKDGAPIIVPTKGTGGVRDPAIVQGGGSETGKKWYLIGTDLDIAKTSWDASQRTGSRGILVWESTDLVTWTGERLVNVEGVTAGMVWAPEAIWDSARGEYFVYWASRFYPASDTKKTGPSGSTKIRSAYTKDFKTFSSAVDYVDYSPTNLIDLTMISMGGNSWARFLKDESKKAVFMETTEDGLHGEWTRVGISTSVIREVVEGPAVFWDNKIRDKAHLLLDDYSGAGGYIPLETTNLAGGVFTASSRTGFPKGVRHGSVIQINQAQYDSLSKL